MKALQRRLGALATRHGEEEETRYIRLVRILDPDLPEEDQDRWIELAEPLVEADLRQRGTRTVMLWSHVKTPGVVTVDGPRCTYLVGIDEQVSIATASILERTERSW